MHGRISLLVAGLALALGGGVAGAALVAGPAEHTPTEAVSLTAERSAADAEKLARASARHALRAAQRARRIARRARNKANEGLATAVALLDDVDKALADSANALQTANDVNSRLNSTRVVSDAAAGTATAVSGTTDYQAAPDGPRVTVTVPASGLIEVWATVTVESDEGAVALFRDGNVVPIPGQDGICDLDNVLLMTQIGGGPLTVSTPPASAGFGICGTVGDAPAPVLFNQPPGEHTYELRYADCGCSPGDDAVFSNRTLRVAPRL